jgi:hypothetical protein
MLSPLFQVFNCSCVAGFFLILDELAASSVFTLGPYDLPADQKLLSICTSNHLEQLWTKCSFKLLSNCYHLVHWSCRMHLLCCCAWHDYRQSWLGYEVSVIICSCPSLMPVFCSKYRSIFYNSNLFIIWLAEIFVKSCQDHDHLQKKSTLLACMKQRSRARSLARNLVYKDARMKACSNAYDVLLYECPPISRQFCESKQRNWQLLMYEDSRLCSL